MRTQEEWAHLLANHGDLSAEIALPSELDYDVAGQIIRERDGAVALATVTDAHGYVSGFRRLLWIPIFLIMVAVLTLTHTIGAN
jgi:hypothetical protein